MDLAKAVGDGSKFLLLARREALLKEISLEITVSSLPPTAFISK